MEVAEITDPKKKKAQLLALGGLELQDKYFERVGEEEEAEETGNNEKAQEKGDVYATAKQILNDYFAPKHHDVYERYLFCSMKPEEGETLESFGRRAAGWAKKCKFGQTVEEIRDIRVIDLIISFAPPELREKLLENTTLTLATALQKVKEHENIKDQSKKLQSAGSVLASTVNKLSVHFIAQLEKHQLSCYWVVQSELNYHQSRIWNSLRHQPTSVIMTSFQNQKERRERTRNVKQAPVHYNRVTLF